MSTSDIRARYQRLNPHFDPASPAVNSYAAVAARIASGMSPYSLIDDVYTIVSELLQPRDERVINFYGQIRGQAIAAAFFANLYEHSLSRQPDATAIVAAARLDHLVHTRLGYGPVFDSLLNPAGLWVERLYLDERIDRELVAAATAVNHINGAESGTSEQSSPKKGSVDLDGENLISWSGCATGWVDSETDDDPYLFTARLLIRAGCETISASNPPIDELYKETGDDRHRNRFTVAVDEMNEAGTVALEPHEQLLERLVGHDTVELLKQGDWHRIGVGDIGLSDLLRNGFFGDVTTLANLKTGVSYTHAIERAVELGMC